MDLLLLVALPVPVHDHVLWVPALIILILSLQRGEIELQTVDRLSSLLAEVRLHAEVVAGLEAGLRALLIVIEVLVEVGHGGVIKFTFFHAVLEDDSPR